MGVQTMLNQRARLAAATATTNDQQSSYNAQVVRTRRIICDWNFRYEKCVYDDLTLWAAISNKLPTMNRTFIALALTFVAASIPQVATADIVLDNFQSFAKVTGEMGPFVLGNSTYPNPGTQTQMGLSPNVFGGTRTITSTVTSGSQYEQASILSNAGALSYSTDAGVFGTFSLAYTNIGSLDLSLASFDFGITSNDNGGTFVLTLSDGTNTVSSQLVLGAGNITPQSIDIGTNNDYLSTALNLNAITSITLSFVSNASTDIKLSGLGFFLPGAVPSATPVVPEPASMLAWGSIIGLGWIASRRNRMKSRRDSKPAVA
jgi:hypothetical protein